MRNQLALIRPQVTADDGDIVVAMIEEEATLKRFYRDEDLGCVILKPSNPAFREEQKRIDAIKAMDSVNDRFGEFKVTFGSLLTADDKGSHVISPAWRPDGIRNVEVL